MSEHNVGTEELGHLEIICAMVYQFTKNLTPEQKENMSAASFLLVYLV